MATGKSGEEEEVEEEEVEEEEEEEYAFAILMFAATGEETFVKNTKSDMPRRPKSCWSSTTGSYSL